MFSLVRSGPMILLLESSDISGLKNYMTEQFGAVVEHAFFSAFEKATENYTILLLTEKMNDVVKSTDIVDSLIIEQEPDVILCKLISDKKTTLIKNIRPASRFIIVHAMGDLEKVIQEIHKDHGGTFGTCTDLWNTGKENGTVVAVTEKPLTQNIWINDLYKKCLYIEQGYYSLFKSLRLHALKYLNIGLGNKDWYEIEIRIFDRYGAYNLHYERLTKVLSYLDLGIILGESWSKDTPRLMMEVGVYRLRFFTFYDPKYIKKILVGLEHLDDGARIVDYDVYYRRKKMDWTDARQDGDPRARHQLGIKYREEIYNRLSPQEQEEIKQLENEILKTRY